MRVAFGTAKLTCQARQVADRAVDDRLEVLLQGCFGSKRPVAVFASCWLGLGLGWLLDMDLVLEVVVEGNVVFEVLVAVAAAKVSGVLRVSEMFLHGSLTLKQLAALVASPTANALQRRLPACRRRQSPVLQQRLSRAKASVAVWADVRGHGLSMIS
jgi:hypothetical protein